MKISTKRLMSVFCACLFLLWAGSAHAVTVEPNISFGMSPVDGPPPEEIDMSWAGDGPYGPAPGKSIKLFILWGEFGRQGPWLSKELSQGVRAGQTGALMFEDGHWQPLKPVGIRHGMEITFGQEMARLMADETVGIIACNGMVENLKSVVQRAVRAAPCDPQAVICQRRGVDADLDILLRTFDMPVIDLPTAFGVQAEGHAGVQGRGLGLADFVYDQLKQYKGE